MNEKNKLFVILGVAFAFIILMIVLIAFGTKNDKELYKNFEEAYADSKPTLVYIGRTSCQYSNLFDPIIEEMSARYSFNYLSFNMDKYSSSYFNKVVEKLDIVQFGTPYLAIIGNNSKMDEVTGLIDYGELFELLQKHGIISKEKKTLVNYVDLDGYKKTLSSKEPKVLVVGQTVCKNCIDSNLALNQIVEKYNVEINYFNVTTLNEEEQKTFKESLDYFKNDDWEIPVMLIVKDNKIVARYSGFAGITDYTTFLTEEGVINE